MNKAILFSVLMFLAAIRAASAMPVIQNVLIQPSYLWLGEDATIMLNCLDNESNAISQVYANITGPITLPTLNFSGSGDYRLTVPSEYFNSDYFDRTGNYNVAIACVNNLSQTLVDYTSFNVSRLIGSVNTIIPSPAYTGDVIEIDFMVKKNGVSISSDVSFTVSLNGQTKTQKI